MTCTTRLYAIEAWRGLDCVGFSSGRQARSLPARAAHFVVDLGADRLYVRREATPGGRGDQVAAWTPGRGWVVEASAEPTTIRQLTALTEAGL